MVKKITFLLPIFFFCHVFIGHAEELYSKSFGDSKNKALIFLHGGPGYNCANFEVTTGQKLADQGFFVIVYDRRGEGRSSAMNAEFTFKQSFEDLLSIYKKYKIKKASLIGHSFGGVIATLFAEAEPKKVESVVLVGAPVSLQETFRNIISRCKKIYTDKNDKTNLNYISMLETMDTTTLEYSTYCFGHAMQNGFYSPKNPIEEAKSLYNMFKTDSILKVHAFQMSYEGPQGFWKNEKYTCIDLNKSLLAMEKLNIPVFGLYGKEDGLYSASQIEHVTEMFGSDRVFYLENCSHSVFVDRQKAFLEAFVHWLK